jgi:hypothetical protein
MRHIFIFFFSLFAINCNAQVIGLYNKLIQEVNDTTVNLQYFKNADSLLLNKLDSFDLFLKKTKYELDSNYFYTIDFAIRQCKTEVVVSYNSEYDDYVLFAKMYKNENRYAVSVPFAFFFYKNRLILCSILRQGLHLSKDADHLLTNLIYEHVDAKEKKLILGYPQYEYQIRTKPVKGYYLGY